VGYTDDGDDKLYNLLDFVIYGTYNEWCGPNAFIGYLMANRVDGDEGDGIKATHALSSADMKPFFMNSGDDNFIEG